MSFFIMHVLRLASDCFYGVIVWGKYISFDMMAVIMILILTATDLELREGINKQYIGEGRLKK